MTTNTTATKRRWPRSFGYRIVISSGYLAASGAAPCRPRSETVVVQDPTRSLGVPDAVKGVLQINSCKERGAATFAVVATQRITEADAESDGVCFIYDPLSYSLVYVYLCPAMARYVLHNCLQNSRCL